MFFYQLMQNNLGLLLSSLSDCFTRYHLSDKFENGYSDISKMADLEAPGPHSSTEMLKETNKQNYRLIKITLQELRELVKDLQQPGKYQIKKKSYSKLLLWHFYSPLPHAFPGTVQPGRCSPIPDFFPLGHKEQSRT